MPLDNVPSALQTCPNQFNILCFPLSKYRHVDRYFDNGETKKLLTKPLVNGSTIMPLTKTVVYFYDTVLAVEWLPQVFFGKNGRTISRSCQSVVVIGVYILPLRE
jgi:hypothetical protein